MGGTPPSDKALSNLTVTGTLIASGRQVTNNALISNARIANARIANAKMGNATITNATIGDADIGNLSNDELGTASTNNGLQFDNIQNQVKLSNHQNFIISNAIAELSLAGPPVLPTFVGTRMVTFNNMTSSTTLDIYRTEGYPEAKPPTIIPGGAAVAPGAPSVTWPIPDTPGWNGNFAAFVTGCPVNSGSTLAEFGFNQLWSGATPPLRETFDISTVPPGIGTLCDNGPHGFPPNTQNCVFFSQQSGFSTQQSFGYNVGMRITPPTSIILPSQTVTCTQSNGDSPNSIGYPNDTSFPKQQTIDYITTEGYTVDFLDPVVPLCEDIINIL